MAIKNRGWSVDGKNSQSPILSAKQDQLIWAIGYLLHHPSAKLDLVQVRDSVDRYGDIEPDDISHGTIVRSKSTKYRAMFKPSDYVDGYEYSSYYVSDRGRLIPRD